MEQLSFGLGVVNHPTYRACKSFIEIYADMCMLFPEVMRKLSHGKSINKNEELKMKIERHIVDNIINYINIQYILLLDMSNKENLITLFRDLEQESNLMRLAAEKDTWHDVSQSEERCIAILLRIKSLLGHTTLDEADLNP